MNIAIQCMRLSNIFSRLRRMAPRNTISSATGAIMPIVMYPRSWFIMLANICTCSLLMRRFSVSRTNDATGIIPIAVVTVQKKTLHCRVLK